MGVWGKGGVVSALPHFNNVESHVRIRRLAYDRVSCAGIRH